jgi:hypothetical protein
VQHRLVRVPELQVEREILARHSCRVFGAGSSQQPVAVVEAKAVGAAVRGVARGTSLLGVDLLGLMVEQRALEHRVGERAAAQEGGNVKRVAFAGIGLQVAAVIPPFGERLMHGVVGGQFDGGHLRHILLCRRRARGDHIRR